MLIHAAVNNTIATRLEGKDRYPRLSSDLLFSSVACIHTGRHRHARGREGEAERNTQRDTQTHTNRDRLQTQTARPTDIETHRFN